MKKKTFISDDISGNNKKNAKKSSKNKSSRKVRKQKSKKKFKIKKFKIKKFKKKFKTKKFKKKSSKQKTFISDAIYPGYEILKTLSEIDEMVSNPLVASSEPDESSSSSP